MSVLKQCGESSAFYVQNVSLTSELSITTTGEASRHEAQMEKRHGVHKDTVSVCGRQAAQRGRRSKLLPL